jgi:hypothetical protein
MAILTISTGVSSANGAKTMTLNALSALDTFSFVPSSGMKALFYNPTTASVSLKLSGSAPTPIVPKGYGGVINTGAGKTVAIAAGALVYLELDNIAPYLNGEDPATIENGAGVLAAIYN